MLPRIISVRCPEGRKHEFVYPEARLLSLCGIAL